jgi:hypothetical protein
MRPSAYTSSTMAVWWFRIDQPEMQLSMGKRCPDQSGATAFSQT